MSFDGLRMLAARAVLASRFLGFSAAEEVKDENEADGTILLLTPHATYSMIWAETPE
jgi:hypothetical protein